MMEKEGGAVRTKSERNIKCCGVVESLLHSLTNCVIVVLGFKDGERDAGVMVKDVVGAFRFATGRKLASHDDAALGEINLLANLIHQFPLVVCRESRRDELRTDVAFAQGLLVYLGHLTLKDCSPVRFLLRSHGISIRSLGNQKGVDEDPVKGTAGTFV